MNYLPGLQIFTGPRDAQSARGETRASESKERQPQQRSESQERKQQLDTTLTCKVCTAG